MVAVEVVVIVIMISDSVVVTTVKAQSPPSEAISWKHSCSKLRFSLNGNRSYFSTSQLACKTSPVVVVKGGTCCEYIEYITLLLKTKTLQTTATLMRGKWYCDINCNIVHAAVGL